MSTGDRKAYAICVWLGFAVAVLAILREWQLRGAFKREAQALAPGAEIRPVGVAAQQGIAELGGMVLVLLRVGPAILLGWRDRSWLRVMLALLIFAIGLIPITAGPPAFRRVVAKRRLILGE